MGLGNSKRRSPPPTSQSAGSRKSSAVITDIDRAVLDLKVSRDKLNQLIQRIHIDADLLLQRSKDAYAKDQRTIAVGLLRLRKFKLNQVDSIQNQILTIAQLTLNVESKEYEKQVFMALQSGKDALAKLNSIYSLQEIVTLMDQVQEQSELEREISSVLVHAGENTLSTLQESQVEAEFLALTLEQDNTQSLGIDLPVVPAMKPLPRPATAAAGDVVAETVALDRSTLPTTNTVHETGVMIPG